jgi:hypothetical protein
MEFIGGCFFFDHRTILANHSNLCFRIDLLCSKHFQAAARAILNHMTNKKTITIIIAILIVVAIGLFAYERSQSPNIDKAPVSSGAPQGKLNINVVCDSVLTYMTFPDSAAADKYVAECKEGQHPEVIEHFKAQLNLKDGVAI